MQARADALGGKQRDHTPTPEHPFVAIIVDDVAFLTAYLPDKALREWVKPALAPLTTQGRAVPPHRKRLGGDQQGRAVGSDGTDGPRQRARRDRLPTGSARRFACGWIGRAGMMAARASRRTSSRITAPGLAMRTRQTMAPNPWGQVRGRPGPAGQGER